MERIGNYTVLFGRYQDIMYIAEILETGNSFISYTYEGVRSQVVEYIERLVLNAL